ncbi:MAG: hypothetical protein HZB13_07960 [Acidobacteria bacterium]|nr:hypothetical protein [Acidobacteriota bacterium]
MAYCPNCGAEAQGSFCIKCGASLGASAPSGQPQYQAQAPAAAPAQAGLADNVAGALCYLAGLITGIIFLVVAPFSTNRAVRFHAFQSIFLHVGLIALWVVFIFLSMVLHYIPVLGAMLSLLISLGLGFGFFLVWLYMMFQTYSGKKVVLPIIGPMAEKQANA